MAPNTNPKNTTSGSGGLLLSKKLWFPSYVDAGPNVAFRETAASGATSLPNTVPDEAAAVAATRLQATTATATATATTTTTTTTTTMSSPQQESSTGGASSDAITEIYDNRTRKSQANVMIQHKRQLQQQQAKVKISNHNDHPSLSSLSIKPPKAPSTSSSKR
jgi:hypothetical protein